MAVSARSTGRPRILTSPMRTPASRSISASSFTSTRPSRSRLGGLAEHHQIHGLCSLPRTSDPTEHSLCVDHFHSRLEAVELLCMCRSPPRYNQVLQKITRRRAATESVYVRMPFVTDEQQEKRVQGTCCRGGGRAPCCARSPKSAAWWPW